jgi:hypothetical protein
VRAPRLFSSNTAVRSASGLFHRITSIAVEVVGEGGGTRSRRGGESGCLSL